MEDFETMREICEHMKRLWNFEGLARVGMHLTLETYDDDSCAKIVALQKHNRTELVVIDTGAYVGGATKLLLTALRDAVARKNLLEPKTDG
jgi:hypothetical protein